MSDKITLYFSSISSSLEVKKHQKTIEDILGGKKIEYEVVDISASQDGLAKMRELTGDPKSLVPQIMKGDQHLGGYEAFAEAVEDRTLEDFLKL